MQRFSHDHAQTLKLHFPYTVVPFEDRQDSREPKMKEMFGCEYGDMLKMMNMEGGYSLPKALPKAALWLH